MVPLLDSLNLIGVLETGSNFPINYVYKKAMKVKKANGEVGNRGTFSGIPALVVFL